MLWEVRNAVVGHSEPTSSPGAPGPIRKEEVILDSHGKASWDHSTRGHPQLLLHRDFGRKAC
jgi:hypothetical protein